MTDGIEGKDIRETKSLITVALLVFVIVAVGFLVAKEIRTSEGIGDSRIRGVKMLSI